MDVGKESTVRSTGVGGYPGGPKTGNQVVPCSWQELRQSGPIKVADDTHRAFVATVVAWLMIAALRLRSMPRPHSSPVPREGLSDADKVRSALVAIKRGDLGPLSALLDVSARWNRIRSPGASPARVSVARRSWPTCSDTLMDEGGMVTRIDDDIEGGTPPVGQYQG